MNKKTIFWLIFIIIIVIILFFWMSKYFSVKSDVNSINVRVGENFALTLESNHTTGYGWEPARPIDENIIKYIGTEYRQKETKLIGAGGLEIWSFQAIHEGNTRILLKYARPWEKEKPPAKVHLFNIKVNR